MMMIWRCKMMSEMIRGRQYEMTDMMEIRMSKSEMMRTAKVQWQSS